MTLKLDHVTIVAKDLVRAVADFRAAGFSVSSAPEFAGGAVDQAQVIFPDGSYLDLLSVGSSPLRWYLKSLKFLGLLGRYIEGMPPFVQRLLSQIAGGEGPSGFGCQDSDLRPLYFAAKNRGIEFFPPAQTSGRRGDVVVSWEILIAQGSTGLPVLIADLADRHQRVGGGAMPIHPNGARAIKRLDIACFDLDFTASQCRRLLGIDPQYLGQSPVEGAIAADIQLGSWVLRLMAPAGKSPVLTQRLKRGEGVMAITLEGGQSLPQWGIFTDG